MANMGTQLSLHKITSGNELENKWGKIELFNIIFQHKIWLIKVKFTPFGKLDEMVRRWAPNSGANLLQRSAIAWKGMEGGNCLARPTTQCPYGRARRRRRLDEAPPSTPLPFERNLSGPKWMGEFGSNQDNLRIKYPIKKNLGLHEAHPGNLLRRHNGGVEVWDDLLVGFWSSVHKTNLKR